MSHIRCSSGRISFVSIIMPLFFMQPLLADFSLPDSLPGFSDEKKQVIPRKDLRGYGRVSGQFGEYIASDMGRASVLLVDCDGIDHAALTLGKYLSDCRCLGGVSDGAVSVGEKGIPVLKVDKQGVIAAMRNGSQVAIVAAMKELDLLSVMTAMRVARAKNLDFAGSTVPMCLDRYDKYGWHFYFDPWLKPKGQPDYDLDSSFKYMSENQLGMLIPLSLNNIDSTEAVIDYANLAWSIERGRELSIPTFIQAWAIGAPRLLINRYPYDTMLKMPKFVGNFYSTGENGGGYPPEVAWSSEKAEDILLSWLQPIYHRYAKYPNVTGYAEPHGEIEHGTPMIFTDYGPVADAAFKKFLREKYRTAKVVDKRWSGGKGLVKSWDDVKVPEVASFLGWNSDAIDVGGRWRFAYDKNISQEQIAGWADVSLDDKSWGEMVAPGDDRPKFRNEHDEQRVPAVFRRSFPLTEAQRSSLLQKGQGKCYLYVWTLAGSDKPAEVGINGRKIGTREGRGGGHHSWYVFEVSETLHSGDNLLALHLPWSEIAYRVYLSPTVPLRYPDLGTEMNARWVDFRDFAVWTRYQQVRKGMEAIRREDPDKYIKLMAPGGMIDYNKVVAEDYGGTFHDTGGMSGWWIDYLPSLMRSSGLPFTIEPGGPAPDLPELKRFTGHWLTEGVNAVDYFINLGDILWDPAQRAWFETNKQLYHLFGKYHCPPAKVAVMYSGRTDRLCGFPWEGFHGDDFGLPGAFWVRMQVENKIPFPRDIIQDNDFPRGNADKYKVIIDGGAVIMDDSMVDRIEQWIRKGGIFVSYVPTGRHTPELKDAWVFSRVSGYRVVTAGRHGKISAVSGQKVFVGDSWTNAVESNGQALTTLAGDCQTLLAWQDGVPAAGMRKIGAGYVITMPPSLPGILDDVLRWSGCYTERLTAPGCLPREYVSNNGLYKVFILWGDKVKSPTNICLTIPGIFAPAELGELTTGAKISGVANKNVMTFEGIAVDKNDIHGYLAPRGEITSASLDWFNLQRDWWQGTVKPRPAPRTPVVKNTIPLDEDWAFAPVSDPVKGAGLVAAGVNDRDWKRIDLGIWNVQGFRDTKHGVFRKEVTVPEAWKTGRIWVWLAGSGSTLRPPYNAKFYIDGELQWTSGNSQYSMMCLDLTAKLGPGKHLLAWDMDGSGVFDGVTGDMWIEFVPDPVFVQSLGGTWSTGVTLPGRAVLAGAKRKFIPDPRGKDYLVQLYIDGERADAQSVYINDQNVYFYGGPRGHHRRMTLNPWLKWDGENEIEINYYYNKEPMDIRTVELRYYRADQL